MLPLLISFQVQAGSIKIWRLNETAQAPVLLVGRVTAVQKGERVPENTLAWKTKHGR
jgi:hypothetical protein